MSVVGFIVHEGRAAAVEAAAALGTALIDAGVTVVRARDPDDGAAADLIVTIGGDGTFLRGAHVAAELDCPVLGVKVGRLGFLTEVEPEEALDLIRDALSGSASIEERLAATACAEGGAEFVPQWALNEIMVEKRARHRLVRLAVEVDGVYVTTFSADGVVVATPTGSTAYSFSARGPIVSPDVPCLVLTPIAAHMVFDRSFVLSADQQVVLEVVGDEPGLLSADGRESVELPVGSRARIGAAERPARLVRRTGAPAFLARVRDKFELPGDPTDGDGGDVGTSG
ncbi:MAG: NAD(+)/NADH kinase [Actinomycetota bacterium]